MNWKPKQLAKRIEKTGETIILDPVEKAKRSIQAIVGNIDGMVDSAKAIIINDDKSQVAANALAGSAKRLHKDVEARRKELIKEPQGIVKKINSFVKLFTVKLETVWKEIDRKDYTYHSNKELERRKQEELIRKANEKLQKDLDKEAKKSGVAAPTVLAKPLPKVSSTVRTEEGSSYWRDNWVGEITAPSIVPSEYCSPDQTKINNAIKQGVREIPGVLIENRKIKSYRT